MIKQLIVGITVLFIVVCLSGCNENSNQLTEEESRFLGTWMLGDYNQLIFYSNKTGSFNTFTTTWEIKDGRLTIYFTDIGGNLSSDYIFSNNYRTLTLYGPDGEPAHYTKQ